MLKGDIMRVVDHEFRLEAESLQIVKNNVFDYFKDYNCIFTDSGRTSIRLLSQILPSGEVLVPYFSCSSVFRSFRKDIKVVFYRVNRDFSIDVADLESKITPDTKTIYVIHSFGKVQDKSTLARVKALGEKHHLTIVEDTTHSVFSSTATIGDYCVCSLRKWFPAPDGGVIYSKNTLDRIDLTGLTQGGTPRRLYPLVLEALFFHGQVGGNDGKPLCDKLFLEGETKLTEYGDSTKCYLMSDLSRFLYTCFDVQAARKKRMENHKYLRELLKNTPSISFAIPDFRIRIVHMIFRFMYKTGMNSASISMRMAFSPGGSGVHTKPKNCCLSRNLWRWGAIS